MSAIGGRFTITYNEELYNYKELRARYLKEGFCFETPNDTECFLASAYLQELRDLS